MTKKNKSCSNSPTAQTHPYPKSGYKYFLKNIAAAFHRPTGGNGGTIYPTCVLTDVHIVIQEQGPKVFTKVFFAENPGNPNPPPTIKDVLIQKITAPSEKEESKNIYNEENLFDVNGLSPGYY